MDKDQEKRLKEKNARLKKELTQKNYELLQANRALEIESALEKVRTRTMNMRGSAELSGTSAVLFHELKELGINALRTGVGIFDEANDAMELWLTTFSESDEVIKILDYFNLHIHPVFENIIPARQQNKPYAITKLAGDKVKHYYQTMSTYLSLPPQHKYNESEYFYSFFFTKGAINVVTKQLLTEEECTIMIRFTQMFGLIYLRFLDLQKAEEQTREAKLETSLERVRTVAMSMRKPDELLAVSEIIFQALNSLDFTDLRNCEIVLNQVKKESIVSYQYSDYGTTGTFEVSYNAHPKIKSWMDELKKSKDAFVEMIIPENEMDAWKAYRHEIGFAPDSKLRDAKELYYYSYSIGHGALSISAFKQLGDEQIEILDRFRNVFILSYQRYQDLSMAAIQTREANIEASLERVRTRTMAMHYSDELSETAHILFDQFKELGGSPGRFFISIVNAEESVIEIWLTEWGGSSRNRETKVNIDQLLVFNKLYKAWQAHQKSLVVVLQGADLIEYNQFLTSIGIPLTGRESVKQVVNHFAFFSKGCLGIATLEEMSSETLYLLERFAMVFDGTYTRFLDLKNAEERAREAKIEAALERVRGKATSMSRSEDLAATIGVFYRELESLSVVPTRCGVGLVDPITQVAEFSTMNTSETGDAVEVISRIKLVGHPVLEGIYSHWMLQQEYHPVLRGNEIKNYYQLVRPNIVYPDYPEYEVQYGYFFYFQEGGVFAWTEKELSEDELKIYRRFTSVFSLTYKRYQDLTHAEANARDAIRQASLDRVRAEIASMRTTHDLEKITPLIWNELNTLGVPFIRCGVFIMDEEKQIIHTFLSTPEGRAIAVIHLPYSMAGLAQHTRKHWLKNEIYTEHWKAKDFAQFWSSVSDMSPASSEAHHQKNHPPENLNLHFIPFLQGMLYVGSISPLSGDEISLLKFVAEAFSTAYARYEDFNKLETAKNQVDKTLSDLKQAQEQLIQSEKMASLGELTAGIAHEIQNPLNFVNNFSELNKELIEEMKAEMEKGNLVEVKAIAKDIAFNEDKINHHGKRADAIVKGMLQHSRSSSAIKELTDINVLCDEYLRLAYHGLRAKDKNFSAKFESDLDPDLPPINVVPQDISRVILNLINNSFYAVNEKRKLESENNTFEAAYDPRVMVSTRNLGDKIEIKVRDNGSGIPENILKKIFQPFFTTKPTGQGTGLGLSLSYDIITKGHGGTMWVASKEGEETEFIFQLPL